MKIIIRSALSIIIAVSFALAQTAETGHYWIILRGKDNPSSPEQLTPQALGISERALKRRAKSIPSNKLIDEYDLPVSESSIAKIEQTGVKIRVISRWLNAVSVEASSQQMQIINALPMVVLSKPVVIMKSPLPSPETTDQKLSKSADINNGSSSSVILAGINYGSSWTQLANMKAVNLHAIGVNGTGVLIGMLDDGFNNYRTHNALKNIKVEATYDFIHDINDVNRQSGEYVTQGNHGAGTLSEIGAYDNGNMIGAAYGVSFILAKTENDNGEVQSEEDNYVKALEWLERLGVDITSSSLGYDDLDPIGIYNTGDIVYNMKDGRTAITSRAVTIAARKGVLAVTAIGNEYYGKRDTVTVYDTLTNTSKIIWTQKKIKTTIDSLETGSLLTPADADSIIAVGATTSDGEIATFSSTGPTADGRIKPDVVAQGTGIYWADGSSTDGYNSGVSGTSCSTPLVAGAAALVLSAHPELTNMQVRQSLFNTARPSAFRVPGNASYPNNYYGNGFVDAYAAALSCGPVFSNVPTVTALDSQLTVSTFIVSYTGILKDSVILNYIVDGNDSYRQMLQPTATQSEFSCVIPRFSKNASIAGYFSIRDTLGRSYRYPPVNTVHQLDTLKNKNFQLIISPPEKYALYQNYPNPFNSETKIKYDVPKEELIEVSIFNILGQRIKTIFSGMSKIGSKTERWDGTNDRGNRVATGIYIVRLKTSQALYSKKMLYIK
jgi:serine protease AprX